MKIELNNDEISAILDALCNQLGDLEDVIRWMGNDKEVTAIEERITFLSDLDSEIRSQQAEQGQETKFAADVRLGNDLTGLTFLVGEEDFIDAGIHAREQQKLNNRLMQGTQNTVDVDIWSLEGLEEE